MQFPSSKTQILRFQTGPLKERVNQGSAEELIVHSSIFHSCASQVAPSRYTRRAVRGEAFRARRRCLHLQEIHGDGGGKREETAATA